MRISMGPTGNLVTGDVLDVSKEGLSERLRDIDSQLYVTWNPNKLKGNGCWELRRRPDYKTALHVATFQGVSFYEVDYLESGICHIKDFAYLNYKILDWVKDHDMWSKFNFQGTQRNTDAYIDRVEAIEAKQQSDAQAELKAKLKYDLMQDKSLIRKWRDNIASGENPAHLINSTK